jgi:hypothetical protein
MCIRHCYVQFPWMQYCVEMDKTQCLFLFKLRHCTWTRHTLLGFGGGGGGVSKKKNRVLKFFIF